jgi:hypothetical protein
MFGKRREEAGQSGITPKDLVESMIASAERHAAANQTTASFDEAFVARAVDASLQIIISAARTGDPKGTPDQRAQATRIVSVTIAEYLAKKNKKK